MIFILLGAIIGGIIAGPLGIFAGAFLVILIASSLEG